MFTYSKFVRGMSLAIVAYLCIVGAVAAAPLTPYEDTYTNINAADTSYGNDATLWATLSSSPGGACTATRTTYLKWDVSAAAGVDLGKVEVKLHKSGGASTSAYSVALFKVSDDWSESSTYNQVVLSGALPGDLIGTKPFPTSGSPDVVFSSIEFPDLETYVETQAAGISEKYVSFVVQLVSAGGCSATNSVIFDSSETVSGIAPTLALENTNAVTLTEMNGTATPTTWPLYAGLAAVALLVVAGVGLSRRRASLR